SSRTNKAYSDETTGVTGPKQMWELACQRCAARAALDLIGATKSTTNTCRPSRKYFESAEFNAIKRLPEGSLL
ncbi:hypothetical protein ABE459_25600, partial [Pseudomonas sp. TWI923]|uniref:hypothetical protein n=1 Tax=Pseudomonas sp. TWI923 TaxID=3136794 RepID=UPI00320ACAAC